MSTAGAAPPVAAGWRREVRAFGELFALCGFAFTQPLLDLFGRGTEQFALRGASSAQIVLFGLAVTFVPALGLWAGEGLLGLVHRRARSIAHQVALLVLVTAVAVQAARPLAVGLPLLALAVATGALALWAYVRTAVVRMWLAFAAVAPVGFLALFLVASPTAELLGDDPAAAEVEVGAPAPVVMLVLDELPLASLMTGGGEIDATLYPNIATLAGDSHWFRNATSVTSSTWHAVPSILTGRLPEDATAPVASRHPDNLFTLLGRSHDLHVTETVSRMCPASLCPPSTSTADVWSGLAGDVRRVMWSRLSLDRRQDDPVTGFAEVSNGERDFLELDGDQPDRFRSLLDELDAGGTGLHYLHILLPHVPYRHLPSGNVYPAPEPDPGRVAGGDEWDAEPWTASLARQRHLLQLQYVDGLVGDLLDELRRTDRYDDALVVLTADHGISFRPGGPVRGLEGQPLDPGRQEDILWVPLFVKEPHQTTGDVSDANVLSIDVLPTIADVLDIELPFAVDGRSALGPPRAEAAKPYYPTEVTAFGVALHDEVVVAGDRTGVLANTADTFAPPTGDRWRLYRIGPRPELVGRRVEDVEPADLAPIEAELLDPGDHAAVPEAGRVPALVRGRLPGGAVGDLVAIAVNGVVAATAPAYTDGDGAVAFAVMIDDALLRTGANQVDVFAVVGG